MLLPDITLPPLLLVNYYWTVEQLLNTEIGKEDLNVGTALVAVRHEVRTGIHPEGQALSLRRTSSHRSLFQYSLKIDTLLLLIIVFHQRDMRLVKNIHL